MRPISGLACLDDEDGDGIVDKEDVCIEDRTIKDTVVFRNPSSVNLCAACQPPPDARGLNNTSPVWAVRAGGREVLQLANSRATLALGLHSYAGIDYRWPGLQHSACSSGTLYVADREDDDWVGFVFSYQVTVEEGSHPLQSANTFYAFLSAKQCCGPALSPGQRGKLRRQVDLLKRPSPSAHQGPWRLVRVNSTTGVDTRHLARAVVALRSVRDQTTVLWTDPGRQGWRSRLSVRWLLQHRPREARLRVRLFQGGQEIVDTGVLEDVEGLMGGRVGLFCKSQVGSSPSSGPARLTWSGHTLRRGAATPTLTSTS
jgi:syndecan 4